MGEASRLKASKGEPMIPIVIFPPPTVAAFVVAAAVAVISSLS